MATTSYGTPYVEAADLVSGYPSTSLTLADRVDDISFKGNGVNNQTGTTYTLDILDAGKTVTLNNANAVTVTIPTNTAEAIEIGSIIRFNNKGAGTVTIQPDGGVTLNGGNIVLTQNSAVQLVKLDTNTWGQAVSAPSGLVLIASTTFSAVSTVSVNNCFTSTYRYYRILIEERGATKQSYFRLRNSGSDITTSTYYSLGWYATSTVNGAYDSVGSGSTLTQSRLGYFASIGSIHSIDISNPGLAVAKSWNIVYGGPEQTLRLWQGGNSTASACDGFTIYPDSGTITGTVRVYGYRD